MLLRPQRPLTAHFFLSGFFPHFILDYNRFFIYGCPIEFHISPGLRFPSGRSANIDDQQEG